MPLLSMGRSAERERPQPELQSWLNLEQDTSNNKNRYFNNLQR